MELLVQDASRSQIVERIVFGGSFITQKTAPNDFDCIVILRPSVEYESLTPAQLWVADTGQATRRYGGDVFVARADRPTRAAYLAFLATNREGKQVGLLEVKL